MRDDVSLEQAKLRTDVDVVRAYGDAHPDAWVEVRFENEPSVRIVALFAGDTLEEHEAALRRLVSHPDQLEVRASPWPRARLEQIRTEIHEMATSSEPGLFNGWGTGGGKVFVRLRADGALLAAQLEARFGDALDLTVGFLHFPDCAFAHGQEPRFDDPTQPPLMPLPDDLQVAVDEALEVKSGANVQGTIRLSNEGDDEVAVHTNGRLTARVIDPERNEVIGGYSGAQTLPLVRFRAAPGGSVEIPVLVGTASIVPRLGYAVPPGRWAIDVTLGLGTRGLFRSRAIPLDIVA